MAYMTRISQPEHLRKLSIPYSQSYLNPNLVPNGNIRDNEDVLAAKQEKKQHYEFVSQYLEITKAKEKR